MAEKIWDRSACDCDCGMSYLAVATDGSITCCNIACRKVHGVSKESA